MGRRPCKVAFERVAIVPSGLHDPAMPESACRHGSLCVLPLGIALQILSSGAGYGQSWGNNCFFGVCPYESKSCSRRPDQAFRHISGQQAADWDSWRCDWQRVSFGIIPMILSHLALTSRRLQYSVGVYASSVSREEAHPARHRI